MKPQLISLLIAGSLLFAACQSTPSTLNPTVPNQRAIEYDEQDNQSLIVMRITGITLGEDSTTVHIAITNGRREPIQIDLENDVTLYDREREVTYNNKYLLSLPQDISQIQIEPGTTMKGQFVFIGRLSPEAKFIKLYTKTTWESSQKNIIGTQSISFSMDNIEIKRGTPDEQNN
jgi:hypothetical protein